MQRFVFWLAYPFLLIISKLPFPVFYLVSDSVFFFVYYIARYRRKTVSDNLTLVFPSKSSKEIKHLRKKFYRHMVDMFLEMIKSISMCDQELKERFVFTNLEEIKKISSMNKSIILACGHYASYEWMNAIQLHGLDYKGFGIYKQLSNPFFDKLARDIRGRFDGTLIATRKATKTIRSNQEKGIPGIYAMIADQSPRLKRAKAWTNFMNIKVPVFMGTENLSKTLDMAVVYLHVEKIKRGYYEATFKTLSYDPAKEENFFIMKEYFRLLEEQIKKSPQYYLWTHKRWKHRNAPIPDDATVF